MAANAIDAEVSLLETLVETLDTCFELGEPCINPDTGEVVSDAEYDKLRNKLKQLNPNSHIFKEITASLVNSDVKKVKHNPPMTSIDKAIGSLTERTDTLDKFIEDCKTNLGGDEVKLVQCYKRDGVAVSLYYEKGKLVSAGLRPRDGVNGEDVTENIKHVSGVPLELWEHDKDGNKVKFLPVTCIIRGELECKKSVFRKVCDDWENPIYHLASQPKNPRNYTAGSIRQFTDPSITKQRQISFTGYSILNWSSQVHEFNTCPFNDEIARAKYSNAVLRIPFVQVRPFRYQDLTMLENLAPTLDYEVDGVVISVSSLEDQEQLGTHGNSLTGNPKAKIAWKFQDQAVEVEVKDIIWNPGRSGRLTPVITFDPVKIDGTMVKQCTAHSLGFVDGTSSSSLGEIKRYTKVKIIKSGKIIPKIVGVVKPLYITQSTGYTIKINGVVQNLGNSIPHNCPSCNSKLQIEENADGKHLICNSEFCGVRAVARLVHFLSTIGVKGISDAIVKRLVEEEFVTYPNEFYSITVGQLKGIGFSPRNAHLIVSRLKMHPNPTSHTDEELAKYIDETEKFPIPGDLLFSALGIAGAGKSAGQELINHFGSFEAIRFATVDQLMEVNGIGKPTAENIAKFFVEYETVVEEICEFLEPTKIKQGPLSGQTFVFTGTFPEGKEKWQNEVREKGGTISGSVSKTTNFVVVGADAGSKLEKAKEYNITILSLDDLKNKLN